MDTFIGRVVLMNLPGPFRSGRFRLGEAGSYARSTGLPIKLCGYCKTTVDDVARQLVIDYVRANPGRIFTS